MGSFPALPQFQFWIVCTMFLHTASDPKLEPGSLGMRLGGLWADLGSNLVALVRGRTVIAG